jgi:hypothetical protein
MAWWVALAAIVAVALALRVYRLGADSFWCDEFLTAEMTVGRGFAHEAIPQGQIVEHPPLVTSLHDRTAWWRIWPNQIAEGYPPLYVMVARFWRLGAGESDVALRWLSVLCSLAALLVLADAVRLKHGRGAAIWCVAIAAVAGPQIEFAQEARGYAMLLLAGATAAWGLARLEVRGASWRAALLLGLGLVGLLLIHYYSWGAASLLGIYGAVALRGAARKQAIAAAACAAVLAAALWGPWVFQQVNAAHVSGTRMYFGDAEPGRIGRFLSRMSILPVRYFYEPMKRAQSFAAVGGLMYVALGWLAWRRRDLRLWILLGAGVVGLVAMMDLLARTRQVSLIRYTLLASLAAYALVAAAPVRLRRPWPHVIGAMVVLACLLSLTTVYETRKPAWREVAAEWERAADAGAITIFSGSDYAGPYSPSMTYVSMSFYRHAKGPIVLLERRASDSMIAALKQRERVLLVVSAVSPEPEELLPGAKFERVGFEPFAATVFRVSW